MQEWNELTSLTQGQPVVVERVRMPDTGIAIEGQFEVPFLAQLSAEDQVFVAAFIRSHGSIKEMERLFGISYPTVKNRLNRIAERLPMMDVSPAATSRDEILAQLERGEIDAAEALRMLES